MLANVEIWYCDAWSEIMHGTPKIKHEMRRPIGDRRHGCGCYHSHQNTCVVLATITTAMEIIFAGMYERATRISLTCWHSHSVIVECCWNPASFGINKCVAGREGISPRILFLPHFTNFIIFYSFAYIFRYTWMHKQDWVMRLCPSEGTGGEWSPPGVG